ncbi:unnamed protein product, partial [marine sediment metagenome]
MLKKNKTWARRCARPAFAKASADKTADKLERE